VTYRIQLRTRDQQVADKTVAENHAVALAAFTELVNQTDFDGKNVLAVRNCDAGPVHTKASYLAVTACRWILRSGGGGKVDALTA